MSNVGSFFQGLLGGLGGGLSGGMDRYYSAKDRAAQAAAEAEHRKMQQENWQKDYEQRKMESDRAEEWRKKNLGMRGVEMGRPEMIRSLFPPKPEDVKAVEDVNQMNRQIQESPYEQELRKTPGIQRAALEQAAGWAGPSAGQMLQPRMERASGEVQDFAPLVDVPKPQVAPEGEPFHRAAEQARLDRGAMEEFKLKGKGAIARAVEGAKTERAKAVADIQAKGQARAAAIRAAPAKERNQMEKEFAEQNYRDLEAFARKFGLVDADGNPMIAEAEAEVEKRGKVQQGGGVSPENKLHQDVLKKELDKALTEQRSAENAVTDIYYEANKAMRDDRLKRANEKVKRIQDELAALHRAPTSDDFDSFVMGD